MHTLSGGLVLGYHGCDADVGESLLDGDPFKLSANSWDWLGPGAYFWEANPKRGYDFACELKARGYAHNRIGKPYVVGAVINPGLCLDLTTKSGLDIAREAHARLLDIYGKAEKALPANKPDLLMRQLDCAVVQHIHDWREADGQPPIDTVRGVFIEGEPIYPASGFYEKTHIQIAVRNLACIKGVFRAPREQYE